MAQSRKKQSVRIRAGIPAVVEGEYKIEWESGDRAETVARGITILSPVNGEKIQPKVGEPYVLTRPIRGSISGFKRDEIEKRQLRVDVSIHTDKWYPQGTTKVQNDGKWVLERGRFGGTIHIIRATLKDKDNRELTSTDIVINVKR